jgi:hypothetical protein
MRFNCSFFFSFGGACEISYCCDSTFFFKGKNFITRFSFIEKNKITKKGIVVDRFITFLYLAAIGN